VKVIGSIKQLQRNLNKLKYLGRNKNLLIVDGDASSNTIYAIRQFQISNKLKVDGVPSFFTWRALTKAIKLFHNPPLIYGTVIEGPVDVVETLCNDTRICVPRIGICKTGDKVELKTVLVFKSSKKDWYFIKYGEHGGYIPTKNIIII
jgi:peptidoglycan hydrolase-like protein with peptidoglycan-binding domain